MKLYFFDKIKLKIELKKKRFSSNTMECVAFFLFQSSHEILTAAGCLYT